MTNRTKRTRRAPTFVTDAGGREIALVHLANHPIPARILRKDFEQLMAAGYTDQWTFNDSGNGYAYVKLGKAELPGARATIARLLMQPGYRRQVKYLDGDRTNLVRGNLYLKDDNRGKKGKTPLARLVARLVASTKRLAQRAALMP